MTSHDRGSFLRSSALVLVRYGTDAMPGMMGAAERITLTADRRPYERTLLASCWSAAIKWMYGTGP